MELSIRPAIVDDAEGFVRAYERAWDAAHGAVLGKSLDELMPFEARLEQYRSSFPPSSGDAGALVADADGSIVGVAVYAAGELRALYVVPESWGSGVAQALLAAALDAIRADGAVEASLWVVVENARARRFYEREGWTADGESRETPFGGDEVRYRRRLA